MDSEDVGGGGDELAPLWLCQVGYIILGGGGGGGGGGEVDIHTVSTGGIATGCHGFKQWVDTG